MKQKLRIKDIITVTLLSLINVIIFFAGSMLYINPITILAMPIVFGLLEGIVFYVIAMKVPKKGAILIYSLIHGIMGFYLPYILFYALAGIFAEAILSKTGYQNTKGLTISYILAEVSGALGGTVYPYVIAYKSFFADTEALQQQGAETILAAANMIQGSKCLILLGAVAVAAFVGTIIAKNILKKHF